MPTVSIKKLLIPLTILGGIWGDLAYGQHTVSPSLNGIFFDDFRARSLSQQRVKQTEDQSKYRYHRGYYRAEGAGPEEEIVQEAASSDDLGKPFPQGDLYTHSRRYGREFGRYSTGAMVYESAFAGPYVTDWFNDRDYNVKLGSIPLQVSARAELEYNDNVRRSSENETGSFIGTLYGYVRGDYYLTEETRLSIQFGLGYEYYFDDPELSGQGRWLDEGGLNIPIGSGFDFDVLVGDAVITFYERFQTRNATEDDFRLDDLETYSEFQNSAGIAVNYSLNSRINFTLGYNRSDNIALDDTFSFLDNGRNSVQASVAYSPDQIWTAGVNVTGSCIGYPDDIKNDATAFSAGVFLSSPITKNTSIRFGAGSQILDFDEGGAIQDNSDLDDYYYNIALQNQLNARVSHSLSFGHEAFLGTRSNFVTVDYIRYGVGWIAYRGSRVSASVFYEEEDSSESIAEEDFNRYGLDIYAGHQLTEWLFLGLGYHYGDTDSSLVGRDYDQHSFSIDTSYPLTEDLNLSVGYQFWTTNSETGADDFDQNRIFMNVNYYF